MWKGYFFVVETNVSSCELAPYLVQHTSPTKKANCSSVTSHTVYQKWCCCIFVLLYVYFGMHCLFCYIVTYIYIYIYIYVQLDQAQPTTEDIGGEYLLVIIVCWGAVSKLRKGDAGYKCISSLCTCVNTRTQVANTLQWIYITLVSNLRQVSSKKICKLHLR